MQFVLSLYHNYIPNYTICKLYPHTLAVSVPTGDPNVDITRCVYIIVHSCFYQGTKSSIHDRPRKQDEWCLIDQLCNIHASLPQDTFIVIKPWCTLSHLCLEMLRPLAIPFPIILERRKGSINHIFGQLFSVDIYNTIVNLKNMLYTLDHSNQNLMLYTLDHSNQNPLPLHSSLNRKAHVYIHQRTHHTHNSTLSLHHASCSIHGISSVGGIITSSYWP